MATVTFTYVFEVSDNEAAEMQRNYGKVYGHSALGEFVCKHKLPAIYSGDNHSIAFEFGNENFVARQYAAMDE